jgi:hypothetical protein
MIRQIVLGLTALLVLSCQNKSNELPPKPPKNACGCTLTDEEMITKLPITAKGDSIVVCKVGTNYVAGSGRDAMTWLEYLQSEYNGGEGEIYDCVTNQPHQSLYPSRILKYTDKKLVLDYRIPMDVYDAYNKAWVDLEIPVYRQTIYAKNNRIYYSAVVVNFDIPQQKKAAFAAADEAYQQESQRQDHYMISGVVKKLFTAALNGDSVSKTRFDNITKDFEAYYKDHDDSYKIYEQYRKILTDYNQYLAKGGKVNYYDLSVFPYFKNLTDTGKTYL